jgi:hypothetical protein
MPNALDYGQRRSRRHVVIVAAAVVIALAVGIIGVRRWRLHQALIEDRRLMAEQRKIRADLDRQLPRVFVPTSNPAPRTTRAR